PQSTRSLRCGLRHLGPVGRIVGRRGTAAWLHKLFWDALSFSTTEWTSLPRHNMRVAGHPAMLFLALPPSFCIGIGNRRSQPFEFAQLRQCSVPVWSKSLRLRQFFRATFRATTALLNVSIFCRPWTMPNLALPPRLCIGCRDLRTEP